MIRTHHSFWFNFHMADFYRMKREYYERENVMISEIPEDYLNLYANTKVTYSDRVHACIATLSYGNSARLISNSPRSQLFDRVAAGSITKELVKPNIELIEKEKVKQVKFISEIIN